MIYLIIILLILYIWLIMSALRAISLYEKSLEKNRPELIITKQNVINANQKLIDNNNKTKWKRFWVKFERNWFLKTYPIRCFLYMGLPPFKDYFRYKTMTMTKEDINRIYAKARKRMENKHV